MTPHNTSNTSVHQKAVQTRIFRGKLGCCLSRFIIGIALLMLFSHLYYITDVQPHVVAMKQIKWKWYDSWSSQPELGGVACAVLNRKEISGAWPANVNEAVKYMKYFIGGKNPKMNRNPSIPDRAIQVDLSRIPGTFIITPHSDKNESNTLDQIPDDFVFLKYVPDRKSEATLEFEYGGFIRKVHKDTD